MKTRIENQIAVYYMPERLTIANVEQVRRELKLVAESGVRYVLLDLTDTEFVDSSGLGVMVNVYKYVAPRQGRVILIGTQPQVSALIELTRLTAVMPSVAVEADALNIIRHV